MTQLSYDNEKTFDLWINETVANEWVHVDVPMYITRPFKVQYNLFSTKLNKTKFLIIQTFQNLLEITVTVNSKTPLYL